MIENSSFYNLDYIIEISQNRLEQYTSAYQKIQERFTNLIIIYSALSIYLIPIIRDVIQIKLIKPFFIFCVVIFLLLLIFSIIYTIRLLIPVEVAFLDTPDKYYQTLRLEYEFAMITNVMNEQQKEEI